MLKNILNKVVFQSHSQKNLTKSGLLRLYRSKKGNKKIKEEIKKSSATDDKMIKLTKKEDLQAKEKREVKKNCKNNIKNREN